MYTLNTIAASKSGEYSSKRFPNLLTIARLALVAITPTIEIERQVLEGAIRELVSIGLPTTIKLAEVYASVR